MLRRESRYRVLTMTSTLKRDNFKETDDFIQGYFFSKIGDQAFYGDHEVTATNAAVKIMGYVTRGVFGNIIAMKMEKWSHSIYPVSPRIEIAAKIVMTSEFLSQLKHVFRIGDIANILMNGYALTTRVLNAFGETGSQPRQGVEA